MPDHSERVSGAYTHTTLDWHLLRDVLRMLRYQQKLTLDAAAAASGINKHTISSIENTKREPDYKPGIETVEAMARGYGQRLSDIFQQMEGSGSQIVLARNHDHEKNPKQTGPTVVSDLLESATPIWHQPQQRDSGGGSTTYGADPAVSSSLGGRDAIVVFNALRGIVSDLAGLAETQRGLVEQIRALRDAVASNAARMPTASDDQKRGIAAIAPPGQRGVRQQLHGKPPRKTRKR